MNTRCDAGRDTLIVIDLQERLMRAIHEGGTILKNTMLLAQTARLLGIPVIGTAQNPAGLGPMAQEVHVLCARVVTKMDFDACAESAFLDALDSTRGELIVAGCETHVCVLQTVLGLLERKWHVRVVVDAVGSRQPTNKAVALDRLKAAGAELVTTEMVLFEWLRTCAHPHFREVLQALKDTSK